MTRLVTAIFIVVVLAVFLIACGSTNTTKKEYAKQLTRAMSEVQDAYSDTQVSTAPKSKQASVKKRVADLRVTQIAIRDAGNRLSEIVPPKDLADTHKDLVNGVRDMADAVDYLIQAQEIAATDPVEAKKLTRRFADSKAFFEVTEAATKIREAGVKVEF